MVRVGGYLAALKTTPCARACKACVATDNCVRRLAFPALSALSALSLTPHCFLNSFSRWTIKHANEIDRSSAWRCRRETNI